MESEPLVRTQMVLDGYENAQGQVYRIPLQQQPMSKDQVSGNAALMADSDPPTDLELLARVIDADCRAYHPDIGYHYDSRCLDHLSDAIARLTEVGALDLIDDSMEPQGRRIRTGFVKGENLIADRPMFSPHVARAIEENIRLRYEVEALKEALALAENGQRATALAEAIAAETGKVVVLVDEKGRPFGDPPLTDDAQGS